ncbi:clarin-3-like [Mya arenaria]|uniref:clarin-3-like n=1 Tax=Mya arenaria TaxID=6604 RepID=UPI0022E1045E|nr:clarin-3-like [Mya arenaria]
METQQKNLISLTFILSLVAIVLIVVSLSTDHWVESKPKLINDANNTRGKSEAHFGLFKGFRIKDVGFGPRPADLKVVCSGGQGVCVVWPEDGAKTAYIYIDVSLVNKTDDQTLYELGLFNFGYYLTIIICAALALVFGMISMGFAIFNICGKPIETITGPCGLYVWNGFAFLFSVLEMAMFLALFFTTLKENFFLSDEYEKFNFDDHTNLGYSFFLLPVAVALFFANVVCLFFSGFKFRCSFSDEAEKVVDNGMILY